MHPTTPLLVLVSLMTALWHPSAASQANAAERNARALRSYMQPYHPTKLEWELLQFNLLWAGSYAPPASYLTSFPVIFDHRASRFRSFLSITESREYQDPDLWSRLSRVKRESILQGAVDQLRELLGQSFPEVKTKDELLLIEFKFRQPGGGFVNAAKFENGTLTLSE